MQLCLHDAAAEISEFDSCIDRRLNYIAASMAGKSGTGSEYLLADGIGSLHQRQAKAELYCCIDSRRNWITASMGRQKRNWIAALMARGIESLYLGQIKSKLDHCINGRKTSIAASKAGKSGIILLHR